MRRAIGLSLLPAMAAAYLSAAEPDSVERGNALFLDYACYSCHGYHGSGRTPLDPATSGILSSEALFIRYLRLRGDQHPVNPSNSMPHYAEAVLSDAQAKDLYAYLVSLDHDAPAVEDIPVFRELLDDAQNDTEISENEN